MPLSGSCHRLCTNPRSSSRRSAGYRVPSLRSKNPFERSRSSWRTWNPFFAFFARGARRQSWIEPFFSSAVHSGETSGIRRASYPGLAISPFGRRQGAQVGNRSGRRLESLRGTRSFHARDLKRKREGGGAYFGRLAFARRYRAGPKAMATTASCAARIVKGVRFTPDGRSTSDSVEIAGSCMIVWPAGYTNAARSQNPRKCAPLGERVGCPPPWMLNDIALGSLTPSTVTFVTHVNRPIRVNASSKYTESRV